MLQDIVNKMLEYQASFELNGNELEQLLDLWELDATILEPPEVVCPNGADEMETTLLETEIQGKEFFERLLCPGCGNSVDDCDCGFGEDHFGFINFHEADCGLPF